MIGDLFLYALATLLNLMTWFLPSVGIPGGWVDAMAYLMGIFVQWNGFLPLTQLVYAGSIAVAVEMFIFTFRVLGVGLSIVSRVRLIR